MAFSDYTVTAKLTAALVLFFLVFLCSWLPGRIITLLHRGLDNSLDQQRLQQVLTGMNCFAGGVFLATCLLDLFPEFRLLMTGEKGQANSMNSRGFQVSEANTRTFAYRQKRLIPKLSPSKENEIINSCEERQFVYDTPLNRLRRHSSLIKPDSDDNNNCVLTKNLSFVEEQQKRRSLDLSVILLLLVLSAHCIFDGLTVGLDPQPTPQALEVTVAVAIHKCVFAFSLGVQYAQSTQITTGLNRSILCYSAASPIGIFTAFVFELMASHLASLQAMLGSVVPAIATGTLAFKIFQDISPATCQS
ncbi:zinc transporter ZIP1-like [Acanthaster planci]|uniref:Zinc transporter ZIP1-like n=1 Tax=Acanthaster planci TaxID=133434 RepID=A0A8B7ZTL6_ACAPL|nr:zinc transporter ZIP1-like [Acanthaster planci]